MKVIFLDVDGVLNSYKTSLANGGYPFEPQELEAFDTHAIKLLQRFCDSSGAVIVLSSAWRNLYSIDELKKAWELPIIDRTSYLPGSPRGEEIQLWLDQHLEDVSHYCIIDDDADMLESQQDNFVHTDGNEGFLYKDYVRMCVILEENPLAGNPRNRNWRVKAPNGESWMI